jgi:hypothetical protein
MEPPPRLRQGRERPFARDFNSGAAGDESDLCTRMAIERHRTTGSHRQNRATYRQGTEMMVGEGDGRPARSRTEHSQPDSRPYSAPVGTATIDRTGPSRVDGEVPEPSAPRCYRPSCTLNQRVPTATQMCHSGVCHHGIPFFISAVNWWRSLSAVSLSPLALATWPLAILTAMLSGIPRPPV